MFKLVIDQLVIKQMKLLAQTLIISSAAHLKDLLNFYKPLKKNMPKHQFNCLTPICKRISVSTEINKNPF